MIVRVQIQIQGIVQGVGFRPFVYSLAKKRLLTGRVLNNESGVLIDVEGERETIDQFLKELKLNPPSLARIESTNILDQLERAHYDDFRIAGSESKGQKFVPVSTDVATCADCLRELFDPRDRRFRYPFINCTNCGPRFTIIEDVPYDREQTTMREFAMCEQCRAEYQSPLDRRFHAEPVACAACGPQLYLIAAANPATSDAMGNEAIEQTIALLAKGKILAVKGIGGFHLACDALNAEAVAELRRRKYREDKPFALMARSLDEIGKHCLVSESEAELLSTPARPIVLLKRKSQSPVPASVAPRVETLGLCCLTRRCIICCWKSLLGCW
jgi:hydrogenase maturation protein HypF